MGSFLHFLNTAELDMLTKTPGITRVIAGNIIAARPFESVDDCLNVHGMGKNLLTRIQITFEDGEKVQETRAMIQVEQEIPPPIEKSTPVKEAPKEQNSFPSRLGQAFLYFIRALFKLVAILIVIGGMGGLLYYGLPYINQKVMVPLEKNSTEIRKVETDVEALKKELDETNARVNILEKSIEAHTASLTKLDEIQTSLEEKIQKSQDDTLLQLKSEVMFMRTLDMIGRARLYLAQSNYGLAREDVKAAYNLLTKINADKNDLILSQAIARLDLVLGNLPAYPVIAAGDLEIAWQILQNSEATTISIPDPTMTSPQTAEPSLEATPTAIP
jgi:hypothetical protein